MAKWTKRDITRPAGMSDDEFNALLQAARDAEMTDKAEVQEFVDVGAAAAPADDEAPEDAPDIEALANVTERPEGMSADKYIAALEAAVSIGMSAPGEVQDFVDEAAAAGMTTTDAEVKAADGPKGDNPAESEAKDAGPTTADEAASAGIRKPKSISDARFLELISTAVSYGIQGADNINNYLKDHADGAVVESAGDSNLPTYIVGDTPIWVPVGRRSDGSLRKAMPQPQELLRLYEGYSLHASCTLVPDHIARAAREVGMSPEEIEEEIRRDKLRSAVDAQLNP